MAHDDKARRALTWIDGSWHEGNPPLLGAMDHATWLASLVFDGARAFEGVTPDLDLHCARVVRSALGLGLGPKLTADEICRLARDGVRQFPADAQLYIRPMFFAADGFVAPDPATTRFALSVYEQAMPPPSGFAACLSTRRRPSPEAAPTHVKAAAHYPQAGLALTEARARGFDNAVMLDPIGQVAEFATANLFFAKDGVAVTPYANGTFLNGITRQRVIGLLRADGITVEERPVAWLELAAADEVFSTGNFAKVSPVTRLEDRALQPGTVYRRARALYWEFAHSGGR